MLPDGIVGPDGRAEFRSPDVHAGNDTLWRFVDSANWNSLPWDCRHVRTGGGQETLYLPAQRLSLRVSSQVLALLRACRGFRTLDAHAREACRAFRVDESHVAGVRQQLAALAQAGALTSYAEQRARLLGAAPAAEPVRWLCLPTRERPAALARALGSYAANALRHGRRVDLAVADDSRSSAATLAALAAHWPADVGAAWHASVAARARYAAALAVEAGVDPDDTAFALLNPEGCPANHGATRNTLLLHTVGDVTVSVDDDTLCRLAPAPDAQSRLLLTSRDEVSVAFFDDEAAALDAVRFEETDFLAAHERLLTRGIGECVAAWPDLGPADVEECDASFLRAAQAPDCSVAVSTLGLVGDGGVNTPIHYLMADGPTRERLTACADRYAAALSTRQVVRAALRPTVSNGRLCQSTNLGLDQRRPLPPFFPVQRNEDGIFGAVLRLCCPSALMGAWPWVLQHAPVEPRRFDAGEPWRSAGRFRTGDLVLVLLGGGEPPAWSLEPRRSLVGLGRELAALASAPAPEFREVLRHRLWTWLAARGGSVERRLRDAAGRPAHWVAGLERYRAALDAAFLDPRAPVPFDLEAAEGEDAAEQAAQRFQRLIGRYGRLLECWPALVDAALRLRQRGVRPAERVA